MRKLFKDKEFFNENINNWDVSNVTNMCEMFYETNNFNQSLNKWNVSNVTNMVFMFFKATKFNQPLNNWNVSNVIDMYGMFSNAISFNQNIFCWKNKELVITRMVNTALSDLMYKSVYTLQELYLMSNLDIKKMLDNKYFYFEYRKEFIKFLIDNGFRYTNNHYKETVSITKQIIHPSIEAVFCNEDLTRFISEWIYS